MLSTYTWACNYTGIRRLYFRRPPRIYFAYHTSRRRHDTTSRTARLSLEGTARISEGILLKPTPRLACFEFVGN